MDTTKFVKILKRVAFVGTGWGLYSAFSWVYDNLLWLAVIGYLGVLQGSIVLTIGAMVINFIFLVTYQKNESDWLGVNGFEDLKEHGDKWAAKVQGHHNAIVRLVLWVPALFFRLLVLAVRKNNMLAFVVLSIFEDSFITTAFLRGKVGGELTKRDYTVFLASTAFSCIYWSARNGVVLLVLKGGWEIGKQLIN